MGEGCYNTNEMREVMRGYDIVCLMMLPTIKSEEFVLRSHTSRYSDDNQAR